jgi:hypothetical protein
MDGNQTRLHQALKELHARATGGETEVDVRVGGKKYRIDVLDRVTSDAYEIQLEQFGKAFYPKIQALSSQYNVIIIHPVPVVQHVTTWEHGLASQHVVHKRQDFHSIFERLVSFRAPDIIGKIQVRVLLVEERVTRRHAGFRGKRPCYEVLERDLVRIVGERTFSSPGKFLAMLPSGLPGEFTNNDVATLLDIKGGMTRKKKIAGCMTYSFCQLGLARRAGKQGNAHVFSIVDRPSLVSFEAHVAI